MTLCVDTSRPQPTKNCDQNNSSQSDHHHFRYLNYYQPNFSNLISCHHISHTNQNSQEFIHDFEDQQQEEQEDVDNNDCLLQQQPLGISCELESVKDKIYTTNIHDDYLQQQQPNISCKLEPEQGKIYATKTHDPNISCKLESMENIIYATINDHDGHDLWSKIIEEAKNDILQEPILSTYYYNTILSHKCLESALANHLSEKLSFSTLNSTTLFDLFHDVLIKNKEIINDVSEDLKTVRERDPACISYVHCLLNFKGFLACQSHRIAHKLWTQGRKIMALMIQSRVSEVFAVDIHPGAKIGKGILLDHATGVVIGETAVIGDNVSILHNVTLGGTGKMCGDRHPKIGDGVLIGAGTCVLGNVKIGDGAKIGAGSVVLKGVPPRTTAVGNPARLIGGVENPVRLDKIPSFTMDHTYDVTQWSDYVI